LGLWSVTCCWLFAQATGGGATAGGQAGGQSGAQGGSGATAGGGGQVGGQAQGGAKVQGGAQAQPGAAIRANPGAQFGIRQTPWFSNQGIRQQLQMNDEQFNQFNRNYSDAFSRFNQGITGLDRTLNDAQRTQRMRELSNTFNREFSTSINAQFANPQQRQRFNQLHLQYQGLGAFSNPMIQQRLNLTSEQNQKLNSLWVDWNSQLSAMSDGFRSDATATGQQFSDLRAEFERRLGTILTPQQQQEWREMVGEPFNFPPDIYFDVNYEGAAGARATSGARTR
jgi:hypothetical protein